MSTIQKMQCKRAGPVFAGFVLFLFWLWVALTVLLLFIVVPRFEETYSDFALRPPVVGELMVQASVGLRELKPVHWLGLSGYIVGLGCLYGASIFLASSRKQTIWSVAGITFIQLTILLICILGLALPLTNLIDGLE